MNKTLIILLCIISTSLNAKVNFNEQHESVDIADKWATTMIGELLYDTDFVFTNTETRDVLLIETYPKWFLIKNKEFPSEQKSISSLLEKFNKVNASDTYLKTHEEIDKIKVLNENNVNGVVFSSHYTNLNSYNYTWIGNTKNHTVIVKLISKTNINANDTSEIINIVKNLNLEKKQKQLTKNSVITSNFGYQFNIYPEISVLEKHYENETYENMGKVFKEQNKVSAYSISSLCHEEKIPNAIINSVILNDLGIENVFF
jgi:hypothetical protein